MMHVLLWVETWVNFYIACDNAKPNKVIKCWKNIQPYSEFTVVRRNEYPGNFKHFFSFSKISFRMGVLFSQCTITSIGLNCIYIYTWVRHESNFSSWLTWIPAWITNCIQYEVWVKLFIHSQTPTAVPLKFGKWICNFIPQFTRHVITYPCWDHS